MKINYDSEFYKNETLSPSPCAASNCANQPLPEATLADIVRENSASLGTLCYVVNNLYTHLYGDTNPCNVADNEGPTCLWDEVAEQARTLHLINEKLAMICHKLGM